MSKTSKGICSIHTPQLLKDTTGIPSSLLPPRFTLLNRSLGLHFAMGCILLNKNDFTFGRSKYLTSKIV